MSFVQFDATSANAFRPDVFDEAGWFLDDIDVAAETVTFIAVDRARLSAEVFLDRWDRSGRPRRVLPLSALREAPGAARPPAWIWHTSFCCSTLIADCLDVPGLCLPLKEPLALVKLAGGRQGAAVDRRLVDGAAALLGRGFTASERVVIKPSNAANTLLADAPPVGPVLLLYSRCRDFMAAVASGGPVTGGGELRKAFARTLLAQRALAKPPAVRWSPEALCGLTDFQVAALLWHAQADEFRAFARAAGPDRVRSLDCSAFLADPLGVLGAIDRHFALELGATRLREIADGPKLSRYAKQPDQPFDAARRQAVFAQVDRAFGRTLDAVVAWSYEVCPETPRGDPVGLPLIGLAH